MKKTNNQKIIISIIVVLLLLIGGWIVYAKMNNAWPFPVNSTSTPSLQDGDSINYDPPTQEEIENSQNGKNNSKQEGDDNKKPTSKRSVSVGIAFADYDAQEMAIDIRAFTPDVIESDGTCIATLIHGTQKVTQSSRAFIDSSSSQCEPILIPESNFSEKGTWKLTVSYGSSKSSGVSPSMDVRVGE